MIQHLPLLLVGLCATESAFAQEQDEQARLRNQYDELIAEEFVSHGNWILDYDKAREIAKAEGKLIFAYFTRSYAP